MLWEKEKVVSVWLGTVSSKKVFNEYVRIRHEEIAQEDDDNVPPISDFAADCRDQWYDSSWWAEKWVRKPIPVADMIDQFNWSESFRDATLAAARKKRLHEANAAIVLYHHQLKPPRWPKSSPVTFICSTPFRTGDEIPPIPKVPTVSAIGITPDQSVAVTGSYDGMLRLWDLRTGQQIGEPRKEHSTRPVIDIVFSADGKQCLSVSDRIRVWDPFPSAARSSAAFGDRLFEFVVDSQFHRAAGWYTGGIQLYELKKRKRGKIVNKSCPRAKQLAFLPDGVLFCADEEGQLSWWDVDARKRLHVIDTETPCDSAAISPNGKQVLLADGGRLACWDLLKRRQITTIRCAQKVDDCVFADQRRVLTLHEDKPIKVWDLKEGKSVRQLKGKHHWMARLVVTGRGRKVITYVPGETTTFTVWDVKTGKPVCSLTTVPPEVLSEDEGKYVITTVAATLDGKTVILGDEAERLQFLRLSRGKLVPF